MSLGTVRPGYLAAGIGVLAIATILAVRAPWTASASTAQASNVAVDCEPSQRALVRQSLSNGAPLVTVQCVSGAAAQTVAYVDASGRILPAAFEGDPRVVPAVYTTTAPVERVERPAPVARPAVASSPATTSRATTATAGTPKRDWKKTALVIGGSAGAGAGLGAIIGGKKGAAIGAAIGGGAGTLYEVVKRR